MIILGDMLQVLPTLPADSVDSCFTDPPYHLTTESRYGRTWLDNENDSNARRAKAPAPNDALARLSRGFMGKRWDGGDIAFRVETWREVLRVLKPGAHLMAFGGTRTYHRMTCAIEDAGFEIRDGYGWIYGTGFPKSLSVGNGWGTAAKPAWEPLVLARKPCSEKSVTWNVQKWGTGGINIDASRIEHTSENDRASATPGGRVTAKSGALAGKTQHDGDRSEFNRPDTSKGRFPANIAHDGSPEVLEIFPQSKGQIAAAVIDPRGRKTQNTYGTMVRGSNGFPPRNDEGSAARFFYCAKADKTDRAGSKHPTVKPVDLIRYYVTMITPTGGTVLDPFAGSGTTLQAAQDAGFKAIGIEAEPEYYHDIRARMGEIPPRHYDLFGPHQPWDLL